MRIRTYLFPLGEFQGCVLYDKDDIRSADGFIVNPIEEELEQVTSEYAFTLDEIPVGYNNLLLKADSEYILVDAGIRKPIGEMSLGLEQLNVTSRDIDVIVITHSDRDHVGGILDEQGEISFPEARYVMLEDSWQYWESAVRRAELTKLNRWTPERTQFVWEIYSKIKDMIVFVKPGEEFIPGLRLFPAPGHRYDHGILKVSSAGEQLIHIADSLAHPLFMGNRDWYSTYDANPLQAIETKAELLDRCAAEHILVFGAHFPFPGLGYVQQGQGFWKWQPVKDL